MNLLTENVYWELVQVFVSLYTMIKVFHICPQWNLGMLMILFKIIDNMLIIHYKFFAEINTVEAFSEGYFLPYSACFVTMSV